MGLLASIGTVRPAAASQTRRRAGGGGFTKPAFPLPLRQPLPKSGQDLPTTVGRGRHQPTPGQENCAFGPRRFSSKPLPGGGEWVITPLLDRECLPVRQGGGYGRFPDGSRLLVRANDNLYC